MAERAEKPIDVSSANTLSQNRILALEIRLSKIGFAVFEGRQLVDWGVRDFGGRSLTLVVPLIIRTLLDLYRPSITVARARAYSSARHNTRFHKILAAVRRMAKLNFSKFLTSTAPRANRYFDARGCGTKREIAAHIAMRFEALQWKLPRPRKLYQSEAQIMLVFDAAATGLVFLESDKKRHN